MLSIAVSIVSVTSCLSFAPTTTTHDDKDDAADSRCDVTFPVTVVAAGSLILSCSSSEYDASQWLSLSSGCVSTLSALTPAPSGVLINAAVAGSIAVGAAASRDRFFKRDFLGNTFGDGLGKADFGSRLGEFCAGFALTLGSLGIKLGDCDVAVGCCNFDDKRGDCCGECCTGMRFGFGFVLDDDDDDGIPDFAFTLGDDAASVSFSLFARHCSAIVFAG